MKKQYCKYCGEEINFLDFIFGKTCDYCQKTIDRIYIEEFNKDKQEQDKINEIEINKRLPKFRKIRNKNKTL